MAASYDSLRKQVEAEGGLYTTTMEELRDIHGAGRLGQHVRVAISQSLEANGMGHFPEELPSYQEEPIRIFRLGTPLADVVKAVLTPTTDGDRALVQIATSEAADVLKKIRQLVCE